MTGIPVVSAAANFGERIGQTRRAIAERDDIDALIISDLNNVRWLTGLASSNAAALVTEAQVLLVTDSRYAQRAIAVDPLIDVVVYRAALATVLSAAIEAGVRTVGVEAESLSLASFEGLKTAIHETATELVATTGVIESLRATKDDSEVAALAMACTISTDALGALLPQIAPGMTEVQIARHLEFEMGKAGAQDRAFETIVATGPNSAIPHHVPGTRALAAGDFLKIDFGAMYDGYHADCTRTFIVGGEPTDRQVAVYEAVKAAASAARAALVPGIEVAQLDSIAREVLAESQLDELFTHGLGHGVGLAIHESPLLAASAAGTIPSGAVVTIEPGVYLPGEFGVRIEDTCHVTDSGVTILTEFTRELTRIA